MRENESLDDGVEQSLREQEEGNLNCPTPEMVEKELVYQDFGYPPTEDEIQHDLDSQEESDYDPDDYPPNHDLNDFYAGTIRGADDGY